jgi:BMFP domain-containing protein YqiC
MQKILTRTLKEVKQRRKDSEFMTKIKVYTRNSFDRNSKMAARGRKQKATLL